MKDEDIQKIVNMNFKLLTLLGFATSIVMDYKDLEAYHDKSDKCNWLIQAIENVVYNDKPLPPMP